MNRQGKTIRYDVVVLGGGPAGTATALSLRRHAPSLSLAVVEQSDYGGLRVGETLPPTAQPLLERLGVWRAFVDEGHLPAHGSGSAWGTDALSDNEFIYHPAGRGWHLERKRFDRMLARAAAGSGAALHADSKFVGARTTSRGRWRLAVRSGDGRETSLEAAFVVDATGRRAAFAARQGVRKVLFDQMLGVFVFFGMNDDAPPGDSYTLVEARAEGWWYSAPAPGGKIAVAFMSDADIVKGHRLNSTAAWFGLLDETRHTGGRVRGLEPQTAPSVRAAASGRLERMAGEGWLAVGDAATTFDPLSSQGVFKGLRSGVMASYAIGDYFQGSRSGVDKYEALMAREFEEYLITRGDYYGRERRWQDSPFWRRRDDQITLAPSQLLQSGGRAGDHAAVERLSTHLPASDLNLLCRLCAAPRQAQEIVSEFKARNSFAPDRRIILALQQLVAEGVIEAATV